MMQKAKTCRLGTTCVPRTFKQMLACWTQHHSTHTAEWFAEVSGVRKDRLYAYSNDNDPSRISLDAVAKICAAVGDWELLNFALQSYGVRVVPVGRTQARDLFHEAMDLPVATGRAIEVVQRASQDGVIDEQEEREIRHQLREVRRQADDVDSVLDNRKATA
jgi:hypothetical protein